MTIAMLTLVPPYFEPRFSARDSCRLLLRLR
jgi:hypothetical protein